MSPSKPDGTIWTSESESGLLTWHSYVCNRLVCKPEFSINSMQGASITCCQWQSHRGPIGMTRGRTKHTSTIQYIHMTG